MGLSAYDPLVDFPPYAYDRPRYHGERIGDVQREAKRARSDSYRAEADPYEVPDEVYQLSFYAAFREVVQAPEVSVHCP